MVKINWIIIIIVTIFMSCKSTQVEETPIDYQSIQEEENKLFPKSWEGRYLGTLKIFNAGKSKPQEVEMELIIEQVGLDLDKWEWKIIYGENKIKGMREYQLIEKDKNKGEYIIDERNSILLDAQFINGKLFSRFSVMGNLILATYKKEGEYVYFEILSGNAKVKEYTGEKEDATNVGNYNINVSQIAKLKKIVKK
jgi:hypothetical protein